MRLMLAPMQGVLNHTLRDILTSVGGYDRFKLFSKRPALLGAVQF